jgi:hypothetical protein
MPCAHSRQDSQHNQLAGRNSETYSEGKRIALFLNKISETRRQVVAALHCDVDIPMVVLTQASKSLPLLYNEAASKIPEGVNMSNLDNALRELCEKRSRSQAEIEKLDQIISGIESLNGAGGVIPSKTIQPKRIISAASRRKMALAQKARWASIRKQSQPILVSAPAKRTMSASARRKIAAAQKARWAKVRAQEKKAA